MDLKFPVKRTFIALPLENEAKWQYQLIQENLNSYEKIFRFQNPASPHLTLYFWSELMEIEYDDVIKKVEAIARRSKPFTIEVTSASTNESEGRGLPRVLWMNIKRCDELASIKKQCPWPNTRPFSPHITIARMRNPNDFIAHRKKIMKLVKDISFDIPVDRIRLYAEIDGVKQTPIRDFLLP